MAAQIGRYMKRAMISATKAINAIKGAVKYTTSQNNPLIVFIMNLYHTTNRLSIATEHHG